MSYSDLELCSIALAKLGARPIDDFASNRAEARIAGQIFPIVRDALLSAHPWTFAAADAALAPLGVGRDAMGREAYAKPADMLRAISVTAGRQGCGLDYAIDATALWCAPSEPWIRYQRRIEAAGAPAFFQQALVARLAAEFCIPITEQTSRAGAMYDLAQAEFDRAKLIDSQQHPPRAIDDFTLIGARGR